MGNDRPAAPVQAKFLAHRPAATSCDDRRHQSAAVAGTAPPPCRRCRRWDAPSPLARFLGICSPAGAHAVHLIRQAQHPDQQVNRVVAQFHQRPAAGGGLIAPPPQSRTPVEQVMRPPQKRLSQSRPQFPRPPIAGGEPPLRAHRQLDIRLFRLCTNATPSRSSQRHCQAGMCPCTEVQDFRAAAGWHCCIHRRGPGLGQYCAVVAVRGDLEFLADLVQRPCSCRPAPPNEPWDCLPVPPAPAGRTRRLLQPQLAVPDRP